MAEKNQRLRSFVTQLRQAPLNRRLSNEQWDAMVVEADLTPEELHQLTKLAQAHWERAKIAVTNRRYDDALEEASNTILVLPMDATHLEAVLAWAQTLQPGFPGLQEFCDALKARRVQKSKAKRASIRISGNVLIIALVAILVPIVIWAVIALPSQKPFALPVVNQGKSRDLVMTVDTQGVNTEFSLTKTHIISFPEAHVLEIATWFLFPQHRVIEWKAELEVLDFNKQVLETKEVVLHCRTQPPLEPGQGMEFFQQINAAQWHEKADSIVLKTTLLQAQATDQPHRQKMPFEQTKEFPQGYQLQVYQFSSQWVERFASHVNTLNLEIENTGLKAFEQIIFELQWKSPQGQLLKTMNLRPVSSYRAELASGNHIALSPETIFDSEVFTWSPGQEPYPVLILKEWK